MLAGFMGAFASQFWFLALALTVAANVRTLALVEVLFAQAVAYYSLKQPMSARELSGIVLIVAGVALWLRLRILSQPSLRAKRSNPLLIMHEDGLLRFARNCACSLIR